MNHTVFPDADIKQHMLWPLLGSRPHCLVADHTVITNPTTCEMCSRIECGVGAGPMQSSIIDHSLRHALIDTTMGTWLHEGHGLMLTCTYDADAECNVRALC